MRRGDILRIATCEARLLLLALLFFASSYGTVGFVAAQATDAQRLAKAVEYLRTVAYNSTLHLCREAPHAAPNVYWIASDNLLAFKALEPYDANLSSTIRLELVRLAKVYNLPTSGHGVPLSLRYDVVIRDNETLEMPPRNITHLTLYSDSYTLKHDIANGTTGQFLDWRTYADLRLLVALSDCNSGDRVNALSNFTAAANMWDGIGLRDQAYNRTLGEGQDPRDGPHAYATYKLGLLLYVSGKLGQPLSFERDVIARIWSMQNPDNGGIFTHIRANGTHGVSDTNTETTAFVILGVTASSTIQTSATQCTKATTVTTTSSPPPGPGIPGFSIEAIVIGLLAGLALTLVRRGRSGQSTSGGLS
jgi:hypothetical protein